MSDSQWIGSRTDPSTGLIARNAPALMPTEHRVPGHRAAHEGIGGVQQAGGQHRVHLAGPVGHLVGQHPAHAGAEQDDRPVVAGPFGGDDVAQQVDPVLVAHRPGRGFLGVAVQRQVRCQHLDIDLGVADDQTGQRPQRTRVPATAVHQDCAHRGVRGAGARDVDAPPTPGHPGRLGCRHRHRATVRRQEGCVTFDVHASMLRRHGGFGNSPFGRQNTSSGRVPPGLLRFFSRVRRPGPPDARGPWPARPDRWRRDRAAVSIPSGPRAPPATGASAATG